MEHSTVGIVGAGPIGIELAIALKQANISYIQFEKGQIAQMIFNFPPLTRFFSSSERISIAEIPIQTIDQQKCPREEYLAYMRSVVMHFGLQVKCFEEVTDIKSLDAEGFHLTTVSAQGTKEYRVRFLVLATGGTSYPRLLDVPGENLPHVSIKMKDPHTYFQAHVAVIGAKNSAVEAALRCYNAGAKVSLIVRKNQLDPQHVKYWLLPELSGRIEKKEIQAFFGCQILEIYPGHVRIKQEGQEIDVPADFVIKGIGFEADMKLFRQIGVALAGEQHEVVHDESMQTTVPNAYVLGTVVAGTQQRYRIFIENTHVHVDKIVNDLCRKLSITCSRKKNFSLPSSVHLEE